MFPLVVFILMLLLVSSKRGKLADSLLPDGSVHSKSSTSSSAYSSTLKTKGWAASTTIETGDGTPLIQGMVDDVAYYHCKATKVKKVDAKNVVLLHGAKFTKENWKKSGILSSLCGIDALQVTALDLSVRATHSDLIRLFNSLEREGLVTRMPVTALITPSASGGGVVDWIVQRTDVVRRLTKFVKVWIPVAANSVRRARQDSLVYLKKLPNFSILSIHGNLDEGGRISSKLLSKHAGAKVVELQGTHPVYLDSPKEFVTTVTDYLAKLPQ